jgi:hypothetical protein
MAKITVTAVAATLKSLLPAADQEAAEANRNANISGNLKEINILNNTDGEVLYIETNGNVATVLGGSIVKFEQNISLTEGNLDNVSLISGAGDIDVRVLTS